VILLDSEQGAARTWFKWDWYLNGQKTSPLRPSLVYHLDAGQMVWNGVARPPLIWTNKDKKREGDQEDRE